MQKNWTSLNSRRITRSLPLWEGPGLDAGKDLHEGV
jgi:hypothetical protein